MRLIDRLQQYLKFRKLTPYAFERSCGLANGYLAKQMSGRGRIGSDILEKIISIYKDLDAKWLLTGEGEMLTHSSNNILEESRTIYSDNRDDIIRILKHQIATLELFNSDKDKIIGLLEAQLYLEREKHSIQV